MYLVLHTGLLSLYVKLVARIIIIHMVNEEF